MPAGKYTKISTVKVTAVQTSDIFRLKTEVPFIAAHCSGESQCVQASISIIYPLDTKYFYQCQCKWRPLKVKFKGMCGGPRCTIPMHVNLRWLLLQVRVSLKPIVHLVQDLRGQPGVRILCYGDPHIPRETSLQLIEVLYTVHKASWPGALSRTVSALCMSISCSCFRPGQGYTGSAVLCYTGRPHCEYALILDMTSFRSGGFL